MSRSQQQQVYQQTADESKQTLGDAENAYKLAQGGIYDYKDQLQRFDAQNPYKAGGEYQRAQDMVLANTADAQSRAAGARLQEQAARTGENPAGAIGATEAMTEQGSRDLMAAQAKANEQRIGSEAAYGQDVLRGYSTVPGMEEGIASGYGNLYGRSLGAEEEAARTPSFMDTLGGAFASGVGSFLSGVGSKAAQKI